MKPVEGEILLDHWQPPPGAGAPIAVFAATFALDADFVDRDCLSRFLSVTGVDESTDGGTSRTVDDIVARIELEDLLGEVTASVLADRSSVQARSTLRWDLLPCSVPGGGLLHSKVAVLMWENSTRVLIGSANLTPAGYRKQVEMMLSIDLGPECLLARADLIELADELRSYLDLIPGYGPGLPAWDRANASLELFRDRVAEVPTSFGRRRLRTILAPSSPLTSDAGRSPRRPLDRFEDVWRSFARPNRLGQVSPYFDMDDDRATQAIVDAVLPKRGRRSCTHEVLTMLDYSGSIPVPRHLRDRADTRLLHVTDSERRLHAKALVAQGPDGVAVLVGSSNHTAMGMGVATDRHPGHREMNVWVCAPAGTREFRALLALAPAGQGVGPEVDSCTAAQLHDEDEDIAVALPTGFEICRALRGSDAAGSWVLRFQVDKASLAGFHTWAIRVRGGILYTARQWESVGRPANWEVSLGSADLPTAVDVEWERGTGPGEDTAGSASAVWAVVVDDPSTLPSSPDVSKLPASVLFSALSRGRSLSEIVAEILAENEEAAGNPQRIDLLAIHDDPSYLLRRGRALATALDGLEKRLSAPLFRVNDPAHLRRRLFSTLGPIGLVAHLLRDVAREAVPASEAAFTIAEIALVCSRVPWGDVIAEDDTETWGVLADALKDLRDSAGTLAGLPEGFREYQLRAFERAESCIAT